MAISLPAAAFEVHTISELPEHDPEPGIFEEALIQQVSGLAIGSEHSPTDFDDSSSIDLSIAEPRTPTAQAATPELLQQSNLQPSLRQWKLGLRSSTSAKALALQQYDCHSPSLGEFSPDGRHIAITSVCAAFIISREHRTVSRLSSSPDDSDFWICHWAWAPHSRLLAALWGTSQIALVGLDCAVLQTIDLLEAARSRGTQLMWTPDASHLVCSYNNQMQATEVSTGEVQVVSGTCRGGCAHDVACMVSTADSGHAYLVALDPSAVVSPVQLSHAFDTVYWSPDAGFLLTVSHATPQISVRLLNTASGDILYSTSWGSDEAGVSSIAVSWAPKRNLLALLWPGPTLQVVHAPSGRLLHSSQQAWHKSLAWSPNATILACVGSNTVNFCMLLPASQVDKAYSCSNQGLLLLHATISSHAVCMCLHVLVCRLNHCQLVHQCLVTLPCHA